MDSAARFPHPTQRKTRNRNPVSRNKLYKFGFSNSEWTHKISDCPAYHPTLEEFDDPFLYLQKIAPEASKYGICKVVSPLKASVPAAHVLTNEIEDFEFGTYVQPLRLPKWNAKDKGVFFQGRKKYTYETFKSMATEAFNLVSPRLGDLPPSYVEKKFWLEMTHGNKGRVEYGVNVEGSAFSSDPNDQLGKCKWQLKTLSRLPKSLLRLLGSSIPGITDPMLYIGMLFSIFAWHVEDHYLYSINYHHSGAPKTWYGVPGDDAVEFEKVVVNHVYSHTLSPGGVDGAFNEIAKKTTMFPPKILMENGVRVYKAVQKPGEFVITFPKVYHAGFSNGFNCGEAVNFATGAWFPYGEAAGKRYALLKKKAIVPFEELLLKESMILYNKCLSHEALDHSEAELATPVKAIFLHHMRSLNRVISGLNNLRIQFRNSAKSKGTILCDICKRDCYLAFIECRGSSCSGQHTCLFHELKSRKCGCGCNRTLFVKEDIGEVEAARKKFEEEEHSNVMFCIREGLARHKARASSSSSSSSNKP